MTWCITIHACRDCSAEKLHWYGVRLVAQAAQKVAWRWCSRCAVCTCTFDSGCRVQLLCVWVNLLSLLQPTQTTKTGPPTRPAARDELCTADSMPAIAATGRRCMHLATTTAMACGRASYVVALPCPKDVTIVKAGGRRCTEHNQPFCFRSSQSPVKTQTCQ